MLHVVLDGEEHDFWDQYLGLYLEAGAPSTHYNTVVQDVQDLGPVKLEEGDVVGVGLCLKEQMVVFSHNGRLLSRRLVGEVKQRLHFPFTRNLSRSIVNIGQRAFYFNKGNTDLISIISYLERP